MEETKKLEFFTETLTFRNMRAMFTKMNTFVEQDPKKPAQ